VDCTTHIRRGEYRVWAWLGCFEIEGENADGGHEWVELSTAAFLRYLPDSGVGVALLCNAEGAKGLPDLLDDILEQATK
jgi:hypothetical protein